MRLSTKTRYGVRAMFDIAFHQAGDAEVCAQAKDIAGRQDIPLRYLEQIFQDLKKAGLVDSRRGPRGGYFLKRDSQNITLADVVRALQGPIEDMFVVDEPATADPNSPCAKELTGGLWRELAEHVTTWFEGMTVAELVTRAEDMGLRDSSDDQPMYYI